MKYDYRSKRIIDLTIVLALLSPLVGCGLQTSVPNAGAGTTAQQQEVLRAATIAGSPTSNKVSALKSSLASVTTNLSSAEGACLKNPVCVSQQIDTLLVSLANTYLSKYLTVNLLIAGGANVNGNPSAQYAGRTFTNSSTGYSLTNTVNQPFTTVPASGKAGLLAGGSARGNGQTPYAGVAMISIDLNRQLLAVAGADVSGYSYCYMSPGYVPVCAKAGW